MGQEEVKKEWEAKVRASFQNADTLINFMVNTMDSFAYRYLNDPKLSHHGKVLLMESAETNMGQALKTANPQVKEAVKNLAKTVAREQKPAIVSRVKVDVAELSSDLGKMTITAQISWDHPEHRWDSSQKIEKKKQLSWNDLTDFRKGFPLALEEVCEIFL